MQGLQEPNIVVYLNVTNGKAKGERGRQDFTAAMPRLMLGLQEPSLSA